MRIYVYKYADYSSVSGTEDANIIRSRLGNPICQITLDKNGLYWRING